MTRTTRGRGKGRRREAPGAGPSELPSLVWADDEGQILDEPGYRMAVAEGAEFAMPRRSELIPLPPGSDLFLLPGRLPVGFPRGEASPEPEALEGATAVAAFLAPAWVRHALPAFLRQPDAPLLPLYAYCAVGFTDDTFWVPAQRVDPDRRQDLAGFDLTRVATNARSRLAAEPEARLLRHVADCALDRACPAARNYFLGRWEAPLPTAPGCNSACVGCISEQPGDRTPTFGRIGFVPTAAEIADLAVPHLETAERAVASFGQGCEGEPLLVADTLEAAIRAIRARTGRGVVNLNTNGSRPEAVARLAEAGLDAIRVSLNSARQTTYDRYYKPRGYGLDDVVESLRVARRHGLYTSVNWLVFPGVSDREAEVEALERLAEEVRLDLVQVRNLNIDPDLYRDELGPDWKDGAGAPLGMARMLRRLRASITDVRFGYFNPPREAVERGLGPRAGPGPAPR